MKDLITGKDADTEEGDQDDYALMVAQIKGDERYRSVLRRVTDRIKLTRQKALPRLDGTVPPYDEFRDEELAKKRASWIAVGVAAVLVMAALMTKHKQIFVWLGTTLVATGSWIIAKGAGLAVDANDWLEAVEAQQAKQKTAYVHEASLLRQLKTVYAVMQSPALLPSVQRTLDEEITEKSSKEKKRYVITQADLARLFLDSSRGSKLGTPIAIFGGILIALGT